MQIEVINITGPDQVPNKKYQVIEIAYKQDGKVNGKKLLSFANPTLFTQVQKWKQGEVYEVSTTKDDNGYWQWTQAELATTGGGGAVKSVGDFKKTSEDRYETREERLARQQYIVRQSSISNAIAVLTTGAKSSPSVNDILDLAKQFEEFVFSAEAKSVDITEIEDDIPL